MNAVRIILLPFSWLYGCIIWIRNLCYDFSLFTVYKVNVPVISVGNLTAGGTGKTPFVEYLVRDLSAKGKKTAVVSRGYKRATQGLFVVSDGVSVQGNVQQSGDEPFQIAKKFPSVVVIVDEKRARAAQLAVDKYAVDCILLDDGFQHRSLYRNLDIVMIDGRVSLKDIPMLPAGLRREPLAGLKRAGMLAVSGAANDNRIHELSRISAAPAISIKQNISRVVEYNSSKMLSSGVLKGRSCVAFCGIGNPQSFRSTLDDMGLNVRQFLDYPDHYQYTSDDVQKIEQQFSVSQAKYVVTTEKDAVKLSSLEMKSFTFTQSLVYLEIETTVTDGEALLHQTIDSLFNKK